MEFYAGGTLLGTATLAPYVVSWDTTGLDNGAVTLTTRAYDIAGNVTVSAGHTVTVDHTAPRIKDDCDPDKVENGCETPKTGLVCVGSSTSDAGTQGDVNTFFCEKPCTTDDDCKNLFGCEKASCIGRQGFSDKFCSPIESGSDFVPCPRPN